jgi:hypothetical protein
VVIAFFYSDLALLFVRVHHIGIIAGIVIATAAALGYFLKWRKGAAWSTGTRLTFQKVADL